MALSGSFAVKESRDVGGSWRWGLWGLEPRESGFSFGIRDISACFTLSFLPLCVKHYALKRDFPCNRDAKLIFTGGYISLAVAFEGPNVILGLCKCNYSLTRGKELGAAAG